MNFVPYDKLSKKKKRALDRARRGGWGALSPVTRREENPKAYKRKKIRLSDAGEADLFRGARPALSLSTLFSPPACRGRRPRRPASRAKTKAAQRRAAEGGGPYRRTAKGSCSGAAAAAPAEKPVRRQRSSPSASRQGGSKEGRSPLLCRFKDEVQGKGNRNPFPWRAFSFCPFSLCSSKEKMDSDQPGQHDKGGPPGASAPTRLGRLTRSAVSRPILRKKQKRPSKSAPFPWPFVTEKHRDMTKQSPSNGTVVCDIL